MPTPWYKTFNLAPTRAPTPPKSGVETGIGKTRTPVTVPRQNWMQTQLPAAPVRGFVPPQTQIGYNPRQTNLFGAQTWATPPAYQGWQNPTASGLIQRPYGLDYTPNANFTGMNARGQMLDIAGHPMSYPGPGGKSGTDWANSQYPYEKSGLEGLFSPAKTNPVKWGPDLLAPPGELPPPAAGGTSPYAPYTGGGSGGNYLGNGGNDPYAWMSKLLNWNVNR